VTRWLPDDPRARVGLALLAVIVLLAVLGPLVTPDPTLPLAPPLSPPSWAHPLGTTGQGQDVLAQTLAGARVTLLVGFVAGLGAVLIGAIVGAAAGYAGGWVDDALSLLTNVTLVLPGLPLAVVLATWLPPGPASLVAVLVSTGWAWNARVIRSEVLQLRRRDWVDAARLTGESPLRVVLVEILPNLRPLLAAALVGATIYNIGAQVGLEFLGLGDPGAVTWGTNLYWAANDGALLTHSWWTFVPTGTGVAAVGFALALLNAGLGEGVAGGGKPVDTPVLRRTPEAA
jgi:peptide/nickel transport system permease protein